jgi:hypothetical protein
MIESAAKRKPKRRTQMKTKIFIGWISVMQDYVDNSFEDKINQWLSENPQIEVVDIQFSAEPSQGASSSSFGASCLILYKEAPELRESTAV